MGVCCVAEKGVREAVEMEKRGGGEGRLNDRVAGPFLSTLLLWVLMLGGKGTYFC